MAEQRRSRGALGGTVGVLAAMAVGVAMLRGSGSGSETDAGTEAATTTPTATATAAPSLAAVAPGSAGDDGGAGTRPAPGAPYCGSSRYVEEITLQRWAGGDFRISVWPTEEARHADDRDAASAEIWQAVQGCVGGVDPAVAESLQDQLRCHESLALVPGRGGEEYATGDSFDVESWRPTPGRRRWISTRCGNNLGTDPTSAPLATERPDGIPPQHRASGEHA
ncbi:MULTISPECIES: DUF2599 domain-containing protein [unclassified Parafrankia]|uniref:DUF2599 domain-containing protein n=1 Tax=unclassified Parafrankia TaxID=2994368 RepID=UPI000DD39F4B|nr:MULTISPECIES: DUF2599 domain-containing protein [unclassified Parafrankia]TCJ32128.1 DUF2599 domain-containing protein [Parafrankia sp. BMG5.11]CAI7981150.1 DUF2599 domain-containing protein [Frankia sp. Hr75.2]